MCHSLYVKANGELPCWDDVGEQIILRKLDVETLKQEQSSVFYSSEFLLVRESFLQGRYPHPGFCESCAVRNQGGKHRGLHPDILEILHLEPSYLCHLSCPECIPAFARHELKSPPYHMSGDLLQSLLRGLRKEGVQIIRIVHFEGRGDPLMNPNMDELVRLVKAEYRDAFVMMTTHGSYPYKPWITEYGLDLLQSLDRRRVSRKLRQVSSRGEPQHRD
jgi:hypothetical protein